MGCCGANAGLVRYGSCSLGSWYGDSVAVTWAHTAAPPSLRTLRETGAVVSGHYTTANFVRTIKEPEIRSTFRARALH